MSAMFGKDPEQLNKIKPFGGTYTQRAKTAARRLPRGGSGTFHWKGNFRPSEHTPDTVRLIPGDYPQEVTYDEETIVVEPFPYVQYKEHTSKQNKKTRTTICSAGPLFSSILGLVFRGEPNIARPCNCCSIWAEDVKIRDDKKKANDTTKGPRRMDLSDGFAFNTWDYGLYFEIPDTDAKGQVRMNSRTNQPYTSWVKGNPNDPAMQGRSWKQGHLAPWCMGKTHKEVLDNYNLHVIGRMCKICGTRDSIVCVMKMCGNPQCGQFIYDPNSTTLTAEQRAKIDLYPYTCNYCGVEAFVDEVIECLNPNCPKPERTSIFDVDLVVQRMRSGEGSQTTLQILNFSEPRPIQVFDAQVLETIKPLDLLKKFAPTPLEQQLKVHGLQLQSSSTSVQVPPQMPGPQMPAPPFTPPAMPQQPTAMMGVLPQMQPTLPGMAMAPPQAPRPPQQPMVPGMPMASVAVPTQQPQPLAGMPAIPYQPPQTPQGSNK